MTKTKKLPEPLKIFKTKNLEGKTQKLFPLERATHLSSFLNYKKNNVDYGAVLLNKGSISKPQYQIRFFWECDGYHNSYRNGDEAKLIIESIASLSRELPLGESLRVEMQCFPDAGGRYQEYSDLYDDSPAQIRELIKEESIILNQLTTSGKRRPKRIILMGTYTPALEERERDFLGKLIKGAIDYIPFFGRGKDVQQEALDAILMKAYTQGLISWQNLFSSKLGIGFRPLLGEEVWQFCRAELNRNTDKVLKRSPEPAPQMININFDTGKISEEIRTSLHPVAVMLRDPSTVPSCQRDHLIIDSGQYVSALMLTSQPEGFDETSSQSWEASQLDFLWKNFVTKPNGYNFRVVLEVSRAPVLGARINSQQLIKEAAYRKIADTKGTDPGADIAYSEAIEAEKALIGGGSPVKFSLIYFIYRKSKEELSLAAREVASFFSSPAELLVEIDTADTLWTTALPFYGWALGIEPFRDRQLKELPQFVASYFPLINTVSSHQTGLEFIAIEGGAPIHFDPFKHLGHTAIWGKTRSGKSLLAAQVTYNSLARKIPVTILDQPPTRDASTFKDFTQNMGGSYVDVFNDSLNFLETPDISLELDSTTRDDMRKQSEDFALQILATMVLGAKGELPGVSSSKVVALLTAALKRFYNDNQIKLRYHQARLNGLGSAQWELYPVLSDFLSFCSIERINLKEPTNQDVDTLSTIQTQLQRWIDGPYGKTINSPSTVALDKPLMAIAMRGVSSNDDAAVFGSIMYAAAMRRAISSASANGSLLFVDEASITFELDALSLCVGRIAANGLKAGMRLMLAAQEPTSVFNSAGGKKVKDAISYHLIGRIGSESKMDYCDPHMLNLPAYLADINSSESFGPDKATCSSQWLMKIGDRFTAARIYLPPSLVALTANNIDERQARENLKKEELQNA